MARLSAGEAADQMQEFSGNPASAGDNNLAAAPGDDWRWAVYGYHLSAHGGANDVHFRSADTPVSHTIGLADNGGSNVGPFTELPLYELAENEALDINLSAATAVGVTVWVAKVRV